MRFAAIALAAAVSLCPLFALAQVKGVCVLYCDDGPRPGVSVPQGPSPEQLRRERDERDLAEATRHELDLGEGAMRAGDWSKAAEHFREALRYSPGNEEAFDGLRIAEQKIREARQFGFGQAARDLANAQERSTDAARRDDEPSREQAARAFDSPGGVGANPIAVNAAALSAREPVVPAARRTPAIAALERQREDARRELQALDEKLKDLDPGRDAVEMARIKQEKSKVESNVQYLNLSITEELGKLQD